MKRLIYSSARRNDLTLAKGIVIHPAYSSTELIDKLERNSRLEEVELNDDLYFLAYTSAIYDPVTGQVDGYLVNHQELVNKLNLPDDVETGYNSAIYFSVDLNSSATGTELVYDGSHGYIGTDPVIHPILGYLEKLFNVSKYSIDSILQLDWVDIDSAEWDQSYDEAAADAENLRNAYLQQMNGMRSRQTPGKFKPLFSITFAVVDPETKTGLVSGAPDFLIQARSYAEYKRLITKFAAKFGKKYSDLEFYTVYTGSRAFTGQNDDPNSPKGQRRIIEDFMSLVRSCVSRTGFMHNGNAGILYRGKGSNESRIFIQISSTIRQPEIIDKNSDIVLCIPAYMQFDEAEACDLVNQAFDELR